MKIKPVRTHREKYIEMDNETEIWMMKLRRKYLKNFKTYTVDFIGRKFYRWYRVNGGSDINIKKQSERNLSNRM